MKTLLVASLIAFWGCAALLPPADPVSRLRSNINSVLSDSIFAGTTSCVKIVSLNSGEVLYDRNSNLLVTPASNLKLLTSSAALNSLGKEFRFTTLVLSDSVAIDTSVHGNVYLKGFGDPDLSVSDLDSLTSSLRLQGIRHIAGDIVADESFFDDLYWGNGWMWDDEPDPDEMFISPLSINRNCVSVVVSPTAIPSDSVYVTVGPPTRFVSVVCNARTVADSLDNSLKISRLFKERLNTITVTGDIPTSAMPLRSWISVWQPALFAGELFKESLLRDSIDILGTVRLGVAPINAVKLAERARPLDSILVTMNKISDNLSAENLLKTIGAVERGIPGRAQNGVYVENAFLSSLGLDTTQYSLVDGSGVSRYNLLTVNDIIRLLVGIARRPNPFHLIYASLPIAGVDGTLESRMKGTLAQGNVRGKTGTMNGVSTLSGYVTTRDGELLAYSMIMENFILPTRSYQLAQDKLCELLASFSRNKIVSSSR